MWFWRTDFGVLCSQALQAPGYYLDEGVLARAEETNQNVGIGAHCQALHDFICCSAVSALSWSTQGRIFMDLLYFLKQRLQFLQNLYDSTVSVFEEKKQRIEAGEPYIDSRDPEYADEPAFLAEWQEADCVSVHGSGFTAGLSKRVHWPFGVLLAECRGTTA
jgi:hypothetical protein